MMNALRCSVWAIFATAALEFIAGCGGSQPPLSSSPVRFAAQRPLAGGAYRVLYGFGGSLNGFSGALDGANPNAGLIDVNGTLFGTTLYGGSHNDSGTIFSISKTGKETVFHSFGEPGDGVQPEAALIDVKGTFYGTTRAGGAYDGGTVFSITTHGKENSRQLSTKTKTRAASTLTRTEIWSPLAVRRLVAQLRRYTFILDANRSARR
jgi:uncharacterized repeat protein (TIGR03803 family)